MPGSPSTVLPGRSSSGPTSPQPGRSADTARPGNAQTAPPEMQQQDPSRGNGDDDSKPSKKSAKRKKNRQRKRRNCRPSFLEEPHPNLGAPHPTVPEPDNLMSPQPTRAQTMPFYQLPRDLSSTSLESEALLDHRYQPMMPRRESRLAQSFRPGSLTMSTQMGPWNPPSTSRAYNSDDSDGSDHVDDRTPLVRPTSSHKPNVTRYGTDSKSSPFSSRRRRSSGQSSSSRLSPRHVSSSAAPEDRDYDINNPPSIPGTPKLGADMGYDDAVVTGADFDFSLAKSVENRMSSLPRSDDVVIEVDGVPTRFPKKTPASSPPSPHSPHELRRRHTFPEEDVCFPTEEASVLADDEHARMARAGERRRRRRREWPDLSILEEWKREEKEDRSGGLRAKKISEPMLVEGRLRPQYRLWRREEDEVPYRFTYFNEEFQSTIHAQTISELVQPGGSFRELFIPDPPELDVSSSEEEDGEADERLNDSTVDIKSNGNNVTIDGQKVQPADNSAPNASAPGPDQKLHPRMSTISEAVSEAQASAEVSPPGRPPPPKKRYGPRPTFWLDVLSPTDAEMRVIAKAFGIHALTAEDIMMQEAREKVELFRNYYFVNYRTFEQDPNSENYLQPVNMYVVVFRDGILSFHFSQTPHPANVRRRIRQLMDYLILSSDWISYAIIDDITDVFGPLIQAIEDEVDEIDEMIMRLHSPDGSDSSKEYEGAEVPSSLSPGEMLRRVGVCRKKVMGMYRLLSNKADVVKGFAKRCNEQWEVAPKSEIGLYLGDIQDHIMTMTSSLTYYETLLSRAHTNYLAQINILMNERQEQTADVLGKLTVMGTIVLPLNIICGMWGMNVKVPGQDVDNLHWFWCITGGLAMFAFASFLIAKRVYKIV